MEREALGSFGQAIRGCGSSGADFVLSGTRADELLSVIEVLGERSGLSSGFQNRIALVEARAIWLSGDSSEIRHALETAVRNDPDANRDSRIN